MAHFGANSTERLISTAQRPRSLPGVAVGVAALLVAFACLGQAHAGIMLASDSADQGAIAYGQIGSDLANPSTPADDQQSPFARQWQGPPLFDGNSPTSGGAGSQTTSGASGFSVVAVVSESPRTAQSSLVSRLALCSRIALPSPLEDRFFRPPRV